MKKILAVVVALATASIAAPAAAQTDLSPFGTAGQLAISAQGGARVFDPYQTGGSGTVNGGGDVGIGLTPFLGWEFRRQTQPNNNNGRYSTLKENAFYVNPGVDYFVIDHLSIGGEIVFALTGGSVTTHAPNQADRTDDVPSGTHIGIMPRVGYDIPIGTSFSLWPRAGIGFQTASYSGGGQPDSSSTVWFFAIDVPFLWHPIEHFFLGAGPGLTVSLSHTYKNGGTNGSIDGNSYTDFRLLSAVIGGYL